MPWSATLATVDRFARSEAAARSGVTGDYLDNLVELGLVTPDEQDQFTEGGLRRVMVTKALDQAGIPLDGLASLLRDGAYLDFIESAGNDAFAPLSERSFAEVSANTGVPVELLSAIREAAGGLPARADERIREDELAVVPLAEMHLREGFRPIVIERTLRVFGDSLRRMAEAESEWWRSEVQDRMLAEGKTYSDINDFARDVAPALSRVSDQAVLALYHAQQRQTWSVNIIAGFANALMQAGLHTRQEHPPAMCFLDITGYTRLTQEQGDSAAAALAERVGRLVQRAAVARGGRAVKWLGDGVMLFFPEPGGGVLAALDIVEQVAEAGLPPAHVGLHAGPVLFQEGDYYGQTVNIAARIGEYARPAEVLVSQAVVDVVDDEAVQFRQIGAIELKGVGDVISLHQAFRTT